MPEPTWTSEPQYPGCSFGAQPTRPRSCECLTDEAFCQKAFRANCETYHLFDKPNVVRLDEPLKLCTRLSCRSSVITLPLRTVCAVLPSGSSVLDARSLSWLYRPASLVWYRSDIANISLVDQLKPRGLQTRGVCVCVWLTHKSRNVECHCEHVCHTSEVPLCLYKSYDNVWFPLICGPWNNSQLGFVPLLTVWPCWRSFGQKWARHDSSDRAVCVNRHVMRVQRGRSPRPNSHLLQQKLDGGAGLYWRSSSNREHQAVSRLPDLLLI